MLIIKRAHKYIVSLALLAVVISFSGIANSGSNNKNPQTELIVNITPIEDSKVAPYQTLKYTSHKVWFNQYIVFNFKSLISIHCIDFKVALKSQKTSILEFLNTNNIEQHLIVHNNSVSSEEILLA